ncbi:MAG: alpha/beta hydrolase [Chitinophagaceae bacterium]|nr:MAG: alpha/beta hydrolase [Chitinophagaceae bacterium]
MKRIIITLSLALPLFFGSCTNEVDPVVGPQTATTLFNTAYGSDPLQKADIYLPAGRSSQTKVIFMIHGGAWTSGDKADFNAFVDTLKRRLPSYAIVNINYRLASGSSNIFPTQENDVKAAVDFIYGKRSEYNISDKFVMMGASAGGHLALLHGFKHTSPVKIKAVVDFFGPSDMVKMHNQPGLLVPPSFISAVMGGTPAQVPQLYQSSSPVNFINAQSAPTIVLQGGLDLLVPVAQSEEVKNRLTQAGVANQYVFYPTGGHGDWDAATFTDAFNKIQAFLEANVQ